MCDCITDVDRHLSAYNTRIVLPIWTGNGIIKPFVETEKIDMKKRGKPRQMFAAYCPFCGVKYEAALKTAQEKPE